MSRPTLLLLGAALVACAGRARPGPASAPESRPVRSNILRADYAGSESCAGCHPAVYQAWGRSAMHNMTRIPEQAVVRAPFDGAEYHFREDSARLEQHGGARFVRVRSALFGDHLYRVTRVIGGRYREDYAGVPVSGPEPGARVLGDPGLELVLPVSYVFETRSFRLKGYSVMVEERPGLRAGGVWNRTCVFCHNTHPLFANLWGALHGPGAPSYQGVSVDRILPPERRSGLKVTDPAALEAALRDEIAFLGGAPAPGASLRERLAEAARVTRENLRPGHLVELGVGCESCHGGSREHVRRNEVLPSYEPRSPFLEVVPPPGQREITKAEAINRACARCHQVLFSRYPYTWEGGLRRQPSGGSNMNSGEARDFLLGGCARQMSCTTCHDPHGGDDPAKLAALATPAGNGVCTGCHPAYAAPSALRAHAHHDPTGPAGSCVACHMPRKNMGLGYEATRYHRIGSPTDRARVEGDRPLECALCHPQARVDELVTAMERLWGKRYDRAKLIGLYGALGAPVLRATLARGKPHEQAAAIAALGEGRVEEAVPALAAQLSHPMPLVRFWARRALEKTLGQPIPVDVEQEAEDVRLSVARWLDPHAPPPPRRPRPKPRLDVSDDED